mgnify:CR=1 FL=1
MIIETRKLLKNNMTYICLCMLLLIVGLAVWSGVGIFQTELDVMKRVNGEFPDAVALVSPHQSWVGFSEAFFSSFYYFIFPLVVALPVVDTLYRERTSGNVNYQLVRMKQRTYYLQKFVFSFLVSFTLFLFPLLAGMLLANILTGTWLFTDFTAAYDKLVRGTAVFGDSTSLGHKKELFSDLLRQSPYLYALAYYLIGGLYAGAYSCFGLAASFFIRNRYLVLFSPLCLYLGCWLIFTLLQLLAWDPFNLLDPRQPVLGLKYVPFVVDFCVIMLLSVFLYTWGVKKNRDLLA